VNKAIISAEPSNAELMETMKEVRSLIKGLTKERAETKDDPNCA